MRRNKMKISYTNDVFFKYALSAEDEDAIFIRHSIIEILTGIQPVESKVLNSEILTNKIGKNIILDIHLRDCFGNIYNIEMQTYGNKINEIERFSYYGAKLLSGQLKKGVAYERLKPVYQIIFIDAYSYSNKKLINCYTMRNEDGEEEGKQAYINRIYVHLPAINKIAKKKGIIHMSGFEQLVYLFKNNEGDAIIKSKERLVIKIMEKHQEFNHNEQLFTLAEQIEIGKARHRNIIKESYQAGIEKGQITLLKKLLKSKYKKDVSSWLKTLSVKQLNMVSEKILVCNSFELLKIEIENNK